MTDLTELLAEDLFQKPWSREILADEDGGYLARIPELSGCFADGSSPEEALRNLKVVLREWLIISLENGAPIPEPRLVNYGETMSKPNQPKPAPPAKPKPVEKPKPTLPNTKPSK